MGNKDKKAQFIELYNREVNAIFRFCLLRTSSRDQAMDITQDTFMRFWDTLSRGGKEINHPKAFLFKVAKNLIIDWYRKKKSSSLDSLLDDDGLVRDDILLDKSTLNGELGSEVRLAMENINKLDSIYREVVYMRFVEDLRPKEIAEIVGETVNVVSVRITRGIAELRKITGYDLSEGK